MDLRCPRCPSATLAFEAGSALGDAPCPSCHGTFVPPEGVERLVHRELGIEVSTLRELMGPYAGTQLTCPSCSFALSHVTLRGIGIEVCTGCGSVWLDDGELERLSLGRYTYAPLSSPAARSTTSELTPTGTAAAYEIESVPRERPRREGLGCGVIAAAVYAGGFGVWMLVTGLLVGSFSVGLIGVAALGLAVMVVVTERSRAQQPRLDAGAAADDAGADDVKADDDVGPLSP